MARVDDFTSYYSEHLTGSYDSIDRIVLNGYNPFCMTGGGMRCWWRQLHGGDDNLDDEHLRKMAGDFSRRIRSYAKTNDIPLIHCVSGERKGEIAQQHLPQDESFQGLFLILVAKAPALLWEVKKSKKGSIHLQRKKPWPLVNHYHFHIIDREWGHVTFKMSSHPPFCLQIMLNGHEWVERKAKAKGTEATKEGNCFVGGSFGEIETTAKSLCGKRIAANGWIARMA